MPISNDSLSRCRRLWPFVLPLISTPVIHALCLGLGNTYFDLLYYPDSAWRDLWLQTLLAFSLALFSRRPLPFLLLQILFMGILFLSNAAKTAFHGVPITLDDIHAVNEYFWILSVPQRALLVCVMGGAIGLFFFNLRYRRTIIASVVVLIALSLSPADNAGRLSRYLDGVFWPSVWDHRGNLLAQGVTLHAVMEGARYLSDTHPAPRAETVSDALIGLGVMRQDTAFVEQEKPSRNIHVIVLESFWDPSILKKAGFNRKSFDARFNKLWKTAGYSTTLTPVFGGYTANSEFECLCGFPVNEDAVKFERRLRNDAPCLPRLLVGLGYETVASHPNVAGFWNRTNAYRRIGFQTYWSSEHFEADDMNREFLSDASLYRQVTEKIRPLIDTGVPVFSYVVTYFGHWDYPLNEQRPALITSRSTVPEVAAFANTVYYKSRELADYIDTLKKIDPDGIIVAFGDHPPFLGNNFAGYAESEVLSTSFTDFTAEMFLLSHKTPLLIINGRKGPVKVGNLPLYRLPAAILSLLGVQDTGVLDFAVQPEGLTLRPLPGILLSVDNFGHADLFPSEIGVDGRPEPLQWLHWVTIISEDLFIGRQFSLPVLPHPLPFPSPNIRKATVALEEESGMAQGPVPPRLISL